MLSRDALDELYAYTDWTWQVFADTVRALPAEMLTQPAAGSGWPSLRECYYHFVGTYDFFLHRVLELGAFIYPPRERMTAWEDFEDYRRRTRASLRTALDEMPDDDLYALRTRVLAEEIGPETMSAADIFANLLLHERGHHGDLSTLLYQLGQEPPVVDYRPYLIARNRAEPPA